VLLEVSQCPLDGGAARQRWLSSLSTIGLTFFLSSILSPPLEITG